MTTTTTTQKCVAKAKLDVQDELSSLGINFVLKFCSGFIFQALSLKNAINFCLTSGLSDRLFSASLESKYATCEDNDCRFDSCDEEERTNIFSHLEETEFTEYPHFVSQNVEDGPYAYIPNKNGNPRLVKKKVQFYGLLSLVFIGSATTGCLELWTANIAERQKSLVTEVGKQTCVWAIIAYLKISKKTIIIWRIFCLCVEWRKFNTKKSSLGMGRTKRKNLSFMFVVAFRTFGGELTGRLKECNNFSRGFHFCKTYYICSCPPPKILKSVNFFLYEAMFFRRQLQFSSLPYLNTCLLIKLKLQW